ncbi:Hypothetical Protein OBI_RACECAR_145 [Arthrobacter phage Racecar]|nr:hypothetical protein PBI_RACECAR_227 [Arthrobacter phage Racecar]
MTKLNQILAIEKGVRTKTNREFTDIHRNVSKVNLLNGFSKTYKPKDEEGDTLPSESTNVQITAEASIKDAAEILTRLFDVTFSKEKTNTVALADVKVGNKVIVKEAPVTYLLFLEKQLTELREFVSKIPTLDPSETWNYDADAGFYRSEATSTVRTKKVPKTFVKYEATDKHPAQVEVFNEDQLVGYWTTTKFSGALPKDRVNTLLDRIDTLSEAVKFAREAANETEVLDGNAGSAVFDYLFAK